MPCLPRPPAKLHLPAPAVQLQIAQTQRWQRLLPESPPEISSSLHNLDRYALLQRLPRGRSGRYEVPFLESGNNSFLRQIESSGYDRGSSQFAVHHLEDISLAIFRVERLAGDAQHIRFAGSGYRDGHVSIGQQSAISAVDLDQHFANCARTQVHHRDGNTLDVAVPDPTRLRVPLDQNWLANSEAANFRLIEIGAHAFVVKIGHLEQQSTLLDEFAATGIHAINGPCDRSINRGLRLHRLRGRQIGFCIGESCLRPRHFRLRVSTLRTDHRRIEIGLRRSKPLTGRGYFAGRGRPCGIELDESLQITLSLLMV